jgi:hypothetical protein
VIIDWDATKVIGGSAWNLYSGKAGDKKDKNITEILEAKIKPGVFKIALGHTIGNDLMCIHKTYSVENPDVITLNNNEDIVKYVYKKWTTKYGPNADSIGLDYAKNAAKGYGLKNNEILLNLNYQSISGIVFFWFHYFLFSLRNVSGLTYFVQQK